MEKPPHYVPTIRELPSEARPRERLIADGPQALSASELLAIILRVGSQGENAIAMANRILSHFGGLVGLARATVDELCAVRGMGEAKATQLHAALELGRRMHLAAPEDRARITGPGDVANLVMVEMGLLEKEEMRVVLLDTKNRVLRMVRVYSGSLNAAVVRVGELFRDAVRANAASIILLHNHPSGDPAPSPEDIRVTEEAVQAGRLLDIEVLDHVIIGRGRWVSMKERKAGFA
ncbi:MAG: RadC family protein [Caldilineaceae bacterium]